MFLIAERCNPVYDPSTETDSKAYSGEHYDQASEYAQSCNCALFVYRKEYTLRQFAETLTDPAGNSGDPTCKNGDDLS